MRALCCIFFLIMFSRDDRFCRDYGRSRLRCRNGGINQRHCVSGWNTDLLYQIIDSTTGRRYSGFRRVALLG